jgi:hypothetical protein
MKKESEVVEIEILTPEQIETLPDTVKTNVTFLTKVLSGAELVKLNPLVTTLFEVRLENTNLSMMPVNDKGEFNVDNIQTYKDLKAKTKSLNATVGKEIKDIKEPILKIQKGLVAVEKAIKGEVKNELDSLMLKFNSYEEKVIAKALEAKAKRDAKLIQAVADANEQSQKATSQLEITNLYNKIKYDIINGKITTVATDVSLNGNNILVTETKNKIYGYSYDVMILGEEFSILDDELQAELKEHFIKAKSNALIILGRREVAIVLENANIALEAKNELLNEKPATVPVNEIEVVSETIADMPGVPPPPSFQTIEQCIANIEYTEFKDEQGNDLLHCNAWIQLKELTKN